MTKKRTSTTRPRPRAKKFDAADATFFASLFTSIAEEMGVTLARTAYSPNIKERRDYSCAVFDAGAHLIAQAAHIPVNLGAMPMSVRAAVDAFGELQPGDVVMLNDPYAGGTHLPDITLVTPLDDGLGYLATRAHHADVGGMSPGSLPLSREIYQEGLRIPPVKLRDAGRDNQAVIDMLLANVRTPHEREGDLRAQLAAHQTGTQRITEAIERHGRKTLAVQMQQLLDYGRRAMHTVIERIPDGTYRFDDVLDGDGAVDEPIPIRVAIAIKGDTATVDFNGTGAACVGSLNAVEAITRSAVYYCFLCLLVTPSPLLGEAGAMADPPLNSGCFGPLTIAMPDDSVVNAKPPHAVAGGNVETSQRIVDVVFGALAAALPDIIPAASQGTMNNLTLGGVDTRTGKPFAYYETIAGGMGARPNGDGIDAVQVHMTNTMNTPAEALEYAYPFRLVHYGIADGTGGNGTHRGGHGVRRDIMLLSAARGALLTERRESRPYGLAGGDAGAVGVNRIVHADGRIEPLPGKATLDLQPGDTISVQTPGGGGWGKADA